MMSPLPRMVLVMLCLHRQASAADLHLSGAGSKIIMGGAQIQASCSDGTAAAVSEIQGTPGVDEDVVLYLINVPPSCGGRSLSQPCAAGRDTFRRAQFTCTWTASSGISNSTTAHAHPRAVSTPDGAHLGIEVYFTCPVPSEHWVSSAYPIAPRDGHSSILTLQLDFANPVAGTSTTIPFEVPMSQNFDVSRWVHSLAIRSQLQSGELLVHIQTDLGSTFNGFTFLTSSTVCSYDLCASDYGVGMNQHRLSLLSAATTFALECTDIEGSLMIMFVRGITSFSTAFTASGTVDTTSLECSLNPNFSPPEVTRSGADCLRADDDIHTYWGPLGLTHPDYNHGKEINWALFSGTSTYTLRHCSAGTAGNIGDNHYKFSIYLQDASH